MRRITVTAALLLLSLALSARGEDEMKKAAEEAVRKMKDREVTARRPRRSTAA